MKKILNRVLAAAVAVPMALTQSVVMNISAEDAGVKSLSLDAFIEIPADQTESTWNLKMLNVVTSVEGTQKEIAKDDFLDLLPKNNSYTILIKELMSEAANPVLTVKNGVVTIKASADMTRYAESKIYSEVRKALKDKGYTDEVVMNEFNKTIEVTATVDANVLMDGKDVDVNVDVTADGKALDIYSMSTYFEGLTKELAASVIAQTGADPAEVADSMGDIELIKKLKKVEKYMVKAAKFSHAARSYANADEMLAAVSAFAAKKTSAYKVPASVDEAVAKHGYKFNKAIELVNDITVTSGYTFDVTADSVAALAKQGYDFEAAASNGTYTVTFKLPDAEAAEVEAYVNANAEPGKAYDSSYKVVDVKASANGNAYFNVTRKIILKDIKDTTTTTTDITTTTTVSSDTTTTETSTESGSSDTTTTTTTTESGSSDTTTTTTTTGTGSSDTTTTTTTTSGTTEVPVDFELKTVEVAANKGYYFSHDTEAFDLTELVDSLTLVGTLDGKDYTVSISPSSFATYLTPEFATPADYFNKVEGTAYVASELALTFNAPSTMTVADDADLTVTDNPMVYIGVKGDADLDGKVEIPDGLAVLKYYSNSAAGLDVTLLDTTDEDLEALAYFLADVDTESKAGKNSDDGKLDIADGVNILTYYSYNAAGLNPTWDEILGK